jgi:hypothetical protein
MQGQSKLEQCQLPTPIVQDSWNDCLFEQNASFFLANAADFFERISFHREWFSLYTNTLCTPHQTRFSLFLLSRASPHFLNDAKSGKRFLCLATILTGCCFKQSVKKMLPE